MMVLDPEIIGFATENLYTVSSTTVDGRDPNPAGHQLRLVVYPCLSHEFQGFYTSKRWENSYGPWFHQALRSCMEAGFGVGNSKGQSHWLQCCYGWM